jgi:hypothetical protein
MHLLRRSLLALALGLAVVAEAARGEVAVDVELVLAADISTSMDMGELYLQRRGHIEALRHPDVLRAITSGRHGRIAVTYFEWADPYLQRVVVPWTLVEDAASAEAAARAIETAPPLNGIRTSISGAIDGARAMLAANGFAGDRRIIDVSGEGRNNSGRPLALARAEAVADGIVINGLAIMLRARPRGTAEADTIDRYYEREVLGGPGAFLVTVHHPDHVAEAIRRKLVLEIAGLGWPGGPSGP